VFIFLIATNKFSFFLKLRSIVHVQVYFGLAEKSHNLVEGAGLERAVFQLGLVLVMRQSFWINLSASKLKLTIHTNGKFL